MRRIALGLLFLAGGALGCGSPVPPATAAERAEVRVVMYTTAWCPVCARARSWLHARSIPFVERDVQSDPRARMAFRQLSPAGLVPLIDVEGQLLEGFVASELREAIDRRAHARSAQP